MPRYYSYIDSTVGLGATTVQGMLDDGNTYGVVPSIDIVARNITATGSFIGSLSDGAPALWQPTTTGTDIYYSDGNVGIGLSTISHPLHIAGVGTEKGIRFGDTLLFPWGTGADASSPTFRSSVKNRNCIFRLIPHGTGKGQFEFFATDYFANTSAWDNFRIVADQSLDYVSVNTLAGSAGTARNIVIETNQGPGDTTRNNPNQLFLDTNGKIGIGSGSPNATLDLQSTDTEVLLRLNTKPVKNGYLDIVSDANRRGTIRFQDTDGTYRWSIGKGDSDELANTSFHISSGNSGGNNAKLVIDSDGNVGINSDVPSHKLSIVSGNDNGISLVNTQTFGTAGVYLEGSRNAGTGIVGRLEFYNRKLGGVPTRFKVDANGDFVLDRYAQPIKVGINTNLFGRTLTVYNDPPDDDGGILVQNVNFGNNQNKPYLAVGTKSWDGTTTNWNSYGFQHRFKSNSGGTPRVTIDRANGEIICFNSAGRVGISTGEPTHKLEVVDGDGVVLKLSSSQFRINQCHPDWTSTTHDENPLIMWDYKSGPGDHLYLASGGNTPISDVMAMIISDGHGFKVGKSGYDGTDSDIDPNNEFFRISNIGRVGIGINNPQDKLHVYDGKIILEDPNPSYNWQFYQDVGGPLIWTVGGTGGAEMKLTSDNSDYTNATLLVGGATVLTTANPTGGGGGGGTVLTSTGCTMAGGAFSDNVSVGGRDFTTHIDIKSTSMRGGVVVRNMNDFRSDATGAASFMHYDPYDTSATSYAFRVATGATLVDTFTVKGNGETYIGNTLTQTGGKIVLGSGTLTGDGQNDISLFATSPTSNTAQSGAFHNKLRLFGGSSQTRDLQLYQMNSGGAHINSSYSSNNLTFDPAFTFVEFDQRVIIDTDNQNNGALRITNNVTDTNNDFYFALEIDQDLTGTQTTTADREQGGIYMNIDSSATGGDTNHEHRAYGMYVDLDVTGDADVSYGVYADSCVTPTTGTVSASYGLFGRSEDNGGAGNVSTLYGVYGLTHSDNSTSDTNHMYGLYGRTTNALDANTIGGATGVMGEIEIAADTPDLYGNSYCIRAEYDNNSTTSQSNSTYLFYGNYSGTLPTTPYGIFINDDVPSLFRGDVKIGESTTVIHTTLDRDGTITTDNDIEVTDGTKGIILQDETGFGQRYRITVNSMGQLQTSAL